MIDVRRLAAGLLLADGLLHVGRVGMGGLDAGFVAVAVAFGVAYLVIGVLLFRDARGARHLGAIAPLLGILVGVGAGLRGGLARPSPWMALLAALDVAVVLSCLHLIRAGRRSPT